MQNVNNEKFDRLSWSSFENKLYNLINFVHIKYYDLTLIIRTEMIKIIK